MTERRDVVVRWLAEHLEEGLPQFRIGVVDHSDSGKDNELIAEWVGVARLFARRDGSFSRLEEQPGADPQDVAWVRRGSAAMLLRQLEGKLALHGAAVSIDGKAVVFTANSGQGKSTLAAYLCAHSNASLLSDDLIPINAPGSSTDQPSTWSVSGVDEEHWLDAVARQWLGVSTPSDDEVGKARIRSPSTATGNHPLGAIIEVAFVESSTAPRLTHLRTIDALRVLVSQSVRLVIDEPERHQRELDTLVLLTEKIPIFRLERPRRLELLKAGADLVSGLARSLSNAV